MTVVKLTIALEVDNELIALSGRLKKVKKHRWISETYGVSLGILGQFASNPADGTTLRTFRLIQSAVNALEAENENKAEKLHKK